MRWRESDRRCSAKWRRERLGRGFAVRNNLNNNNTQTLFFWIHFSSSSADWLTGLLVCEYALSELLPLKKVADRYAVSMVWLAALLWLLADWPTG